MKLLKMLTLFISLALLGCASIIPTPILINRVIKSNDHTLSVWDSCSEGANYRPRLSACSKEALFLGVHETRTLATELIKADYKQPQGYDIYLSITMIYFRIGQRNENDYSLAEKIARQFFEVQKATSRGSLNTARFYLAHYTAAHASYQHLHKPDALDDVRKMDFLIAVSEGFKALGSTTGTRTVLLDRAIRILNAVIQII